MSLSDCHNGRGEKGMQGTGVQGPVWELHRLQAV